MSAERWNRALLRHAGFAELRKAERALSRKKRFVYRDAGKLRVIDLKLRPRVMGRAQLGYLSRVTRRVARVQRAVAAAWLNDAKLRRAVPLADAERDFMEPLLASPRALAAPVVMRLDASVAFSARDWHHKLELFEVNSLGVGGLALTPIAAEVVSELVVPHLGSKLKAGPDTRHALVELFERRGTVGLVEERDDDSGVAEYDDLRDWFRRHGLKAHVGDVRDLELDGGRLLLGGRPVDCIYRDTEAKDLVVMRGAASAREALRHAFLHGRVVSGIVGDFDHKSLFEVVTDPELLARVVPAGHRALLQRHALWTRLVYPRRTTDERGARVDIEKHLRAQRERYVLKPNRAYGGVGVTIGIDTTARDWSRALSRAFERPGTWVCQQLGEVMREDFPVVKDDGSIELQRHFVDCGIYKVGETYGILSRAAHRRVVNVSSGGGLSVVLFE